MTLKLVTGVQAFCNILSDLACPGFELETSRMAHTTRRCW